MTEETAEHLYERFKRENPNLKDFLPWLVSLNSESDRGRVIISCSYLEELIRDIILALLIETKETEKLFDGFNAPLGTFSARATTAYALGLITEEEFKEIETLKKIRNVFAHNFKASFYDSKIASLCNLLKYSVNELGSTATDRVTRYTSAAVALIISLINRKHYVKRKRLTARTWPN